MAQSYIATFADLTVHSTGDTMVRMADGGDGWVQSQQPHAGVDVLDFFSKCA